MPVFRRVPDESGSWSKAGRCRDTLRFPTNSGVNRKIRVEAPMILYEDRRLLIVAIVRASRSKVDRANLDSLAIEHGDRLRVELPLIGRPGKGRSHLNLVD